MYIAQCSNCGAMYKCQKVNENYITDFNDNITDKCVKCQKHTKLNIIETADWIADLVFTIKGK